MEIPLSFAFGFLTDFYDLLIPGMELHVILRLGLFIMTLFVTAMGVFLCVKTDVVLAPPDGIVKTISEVFRLRFSAVKNTFDISMVVISILLCVGHHTKLYGIGIGTVLSALCLGRIIRVYEKYVPTAGIEKVP